MKPVAGTGGPGSGADQASTTSDAGPAPQCDQYAFPKPPVALVIDCPREACGLNGVWLGRGVPFRTLHLHGGANPENLAILDFRSAPTATAPTGEPLTIDLHEDILTGTPTAGGGTPLSGPPLAGSSLFLGPPGGPPTYRLTIDRVSFAEFWALCPRCGGTGRPAPQYHFTARSLIDNCELAVCDPALAEQAHTGISGDAVIFTGDYYDDMRYTVSDAPLTERSNLDGDLFNIACRGTAIYKLYMFRHARASATNSSAVTEVGQRTSLLRLLTADYCGIGKAFTTDGVPIKLGLNPAATHYTITERSYNIRDGGEPDAFWTERGASCLGTPRFSHFMDLATLLGKIHEKCTPSSCGAGVGPGWYARSANPR